MQFSFDGINSSPCIVSYDHLNYINKMHLGRRIEDLADTSLLEETRKVLVGRGGVETKMRERLWDDGYLRKVLQAVKVSEYKVIVMVVLMNE
jgi:hypothetical protein